MRPALVVVLGVAALVCGEEVAAESEEAGSHTRSIYTTFSSTFSSYTSSSTNTTAFAIATAIYAPAMIVWTAFNTARKRALKARNKNHEIPFNAAELAKKLGEDVGSDSQSPNDIVGYCVTQRLLAASFAEAEKEPEVVKDRESMLRSLATNKRLMRKTERHITKLLEKFPETTTVNPNPLRVRALIAMGHLKRVQEDKTYAQQLAVEAFEEAQANDLYVVRNLDGEAAGEPVAYVTSTGETKEYLPEGVGSLDEVKEIEKVEGPLELDEASGSGDRSGGNYYSYFSGDRSGSGADDADGDESEAGDGDYGSDF